jgi:hypothetical protein
LHEVPYMDTPLFCKKNHNLKLKEKIAVIYSAYL